MSDGTGAAPASAPAEGSTQGDGQQSAKPTAAGAALKASATQQPSWTDDDDKAFFELAKKSPYKARIKGEERGIDSKQSLQDLLNHAQRGIGANKVVEESRKEAAAAKAEREEAAKERALVDRARKGDFEARKALGLVPAEELHKRKSEWESVPPEVRQLYEERNKAHEELQTLRAEKEQREAEVARRREETELGQARRMALDATHGLLDQLGVTEDNAERYLPHVAGAIADLADYGLELGVDMTPDLIAERVKQRIGGMDEQHFSSLSPKRAVALMESHLAKMDDSALLETVSDKLARRISRAYAQRITGQRKQAAPQQTMQREVERRPELPKVLSPFRFKR